MLNFDETKPQPKCVSCGKPKNEHQSKTTACPIGSKHRVLGYTQYSGVSFFAEKRLDD
jgi:hypothetical protein